MARLLVLTLLMLFYGSLYPWRFHEPRANPIVLLIHSWPRVWTAAYGPDIVLNVLLFVPLGVLGFLTFAGRMRQRSAAVLTAVLGACTSAGIELSQAYFGRDTGLLDIITNTGGTCAGLTVAALLSHHRLPSPVRTVTRRLDILLLLFCWVVYSLYPFTSYTWRLWALRPAVVHQPVAMAAPAFVLAFVEALALVRLLEVMANLRLRESLGAMIAWVVAIVLVMFRPFIVGRTLHMAEASGLWLGLAVALVLPRLPGLAFLFAAALIASGLAPYRLGAEPAVFSWVPFAASLASNWDEGVAIFAGKAFRYGVLIWLLAESGWRLRYAAAAAVALLTAIEVFQIRIPGHVAEISDPILALIMAFAMWSAHDAGKIMGKREVRAPG